MPIDFTFEGETLTLATEAEMKMAILMGRVVSRKNGISTYAYRGRSYLLSDRDLQEAAVTAGRRTRQTRRRG
jgi:hypothetical protein